MPKLLLFCFEPVPPWAATAAGSLAGAVISVLPMMALSPVSLGLNRGVNGVTTAGASRSSRLSRAGTNREDRPGAALRRPLLSEGVLLMVQSTQSGVS